MKLRIVMAWIAMFGLLACMARPVLAEEWVNSRVLLNGKDKGNFFFALTSDGKVLFQREDLQQLGLKDIPLGTVTGKDGYVSLAPNVSASFDRRASILTLTVASRMLEKIQHTPSSSGKGLKHLKVALFLNGEAAGTHEVMLTDAGKIFIRRGELSRIGIKAIPTDGMVGKDGFVSLSPNVTAVLDEEALLLHLRMSPEMVDKPVVKEEREAQEQKSDLMIANVLLNEEDKGDFFIQRNTGGEILFAKADMHRLGLEGPGGSATDAEQYVSLPPRVTARLDEEQLVLHLTAEPDQLGKSMIDLSHRQRGVDNMLDGSGSGFINYGISYNADDKLDFTSLVVPLEAGVTINGILGLSSFIYTKHEEDERLVRLMSSIVKDIPVRQTRIIAGDYSASSGMLGSGGLFGGLSIAKKFSMDPYSAHYPGASLYGAVNTPSDVEVYVNGLLVGKEHLSPGEFEFTNVGSVQGSGDATLVVKDAYGNAETIIVPYYTSSQLLKPGLHDYSYNLGYQREQFGVKSSEYGDAAILASHRVGFTRAFTAGLRAEGDKDVTNGGISATFILGSIGEFDTSYAYSREGELRGSAWSVRYSRAGRYLSGSLFSRSYSREYANLMLTSADDKPRLEGSANVGFHQQQLGSLSLFYAKKDMYQEVDRKRYGVSYTRRLLPDVALNIVAARTEEQTTTNEIYANLMFLLGSSRSANISYQQQDTSSTERVGLQKNAPLGTGYGYRLGADRSETEQVDAVNGANAYLEYRGHHGVYSAEGRSIDGSNSYTAGTAGGIAFVNSSAYFTRPIYDGFALAKVGTLHNVDVKYNNQDIGTTDENGELLIPSLISYHRNSISIDDKDIPINYQISAVDRAVTVPYRAGGVVDFPMEKLQAFTGKLLLAESGKTTPAEYWGLKLDNASQEQEVIVGKRGEFYLENLTAGDFSARLFRGMEECRFKLTIPESDAMMVDLGEVTCDRN